GDLGQGGDLDEAARPAGDVVEHDREVGGVGDGAEVRDQRSLLRLRVVRSDRQDPVRSRRGGPFGQLDRLGGVVRAGTGDDLGTLADGLFAGGEQRDLLVGGQGGRLPRRTGHYEAVRAVLDEIAGEAVG